MDIDEINNIIREHYRSGAYRNHSLRMHGALLAELIEHYASESKYDFMRTGVVDTMWGIPIDIDDSMQIGEWELVDRLTRELAKKGTVDITARPVSPDSV